MLPNGGSPEFNLICSDPIGKCCLIDDNDIIGSEYPSDNTSFTQLDL